MAIKIMVLATSDRIDEKLDVGDKPSYVELAMALSSIKKIEHELIEMMANIEPEYEVTG